MSKAPTGTGRSLQGSLSLKVKKPYPSATTQELRTDAARDWFKPEEALANAPRQANGLFIVPKVIDS